MPDRTLHTVTPLTANQKAERFDASVSIEIKGSSKRWMVTQKWERDTTASDSSYGNVESYTAVESDKSLFLLTTAGDLDVVALSQVILSEVQRQQKARQA